MATVRSRAFAFMIAVWLDRSWTLEEWFHPNTGLSKLPTKAQHEEGVRWRVVRKKKGDFEKVTVQTAIPGLSQ
jgi:hypothetical protein